MKGSDINPLELFAEGNPKVTTQKRKDLQKKVSKSYYCNWHIMQEKWDFGAEMHSKVFSMFFLQIIAMMKNYEE